MWSYQLRLVYAVLYATMYADYNTKEVNMYVQQRLRPESHEKLLEIAVSRKEKGHRVNSNVHILDELISKAHKRECKK